MYLFSKNISEINVPGAYTRKLVSNHAGKWILLKISGTCWRGGFCFKLRDFLNKIK